MTKTYMRFPSSPRLELESRVASKARDEDARRKRFVKLMYLRSSDMGIVIYEVLNDVTCEGKG